MSWNLEVIHKIWASIMDFDEKHAKSFETYESVKCN